MPSPRIIKQPVDTMRLATQNATFVCVGQGYGFIDISWIRGVRINERPPPSKSIVTTVITPDSITNTLIIPKLRDRDKGRYKCRFVNSAGGTDSYRALLSIESKCLHFSVATYL